MKQIFDRLVALLIAVSDLAKPSRQKRVNDRSEKNDGRNKVERFPLNPPREFSEKRRNLLVMVAIGRQRKVCSRFQYPCSRGRMSSQTQRQSDTKKKQSFTRKHPRSLSGVRVQPGQFASESNITGSSM